MVVTGGVVELLKGMRLLNIEGMTVVHVGKPWSFTAPPCCREMVPHLENKENLVYWFQPVGGTPSEQIPALKYQGQFYALSLRMMKCIWRHTRLRKGFRNLECGHFGTYKLRIPKQLMLEKVRTHRKVRLLPLHFLH